ncbi:TPA: tagatose-bisphosphate aldolase subunit GatZ [Vibrio parahaemolyticus]|nr:tagatose-bisphosphate aldolase subunit GatZ [Vibrio parahaemolyticus]HAS6854805.1 tagatose-bisphosphate aldolase subunit GatZ [Vibrio parahaemolyticus]HCG8648322.1 tagatose-bisphosphate aldolase subunit GatZ [Vibrio parahaemolyticus]HCG8650722.1 tagatose-bisphosphate aldolase subunit GatZ [Vibrio parahaemolyticus]
MKDIITSHKENANIGIYSVCSAHPLVIKAAMIYELNTGNKVLIEATSNQVNQFGGYTGMKPKDFVNYVAKLAEEVGFPMEKVILGGDHLGPNCWQKEPSQEAMEKSKVLIKDYIEAGFTKIHLDASMSCADDQVPLDPQVVAERAAILCKVAETYATEEQKEQLTYIVGTEVPVPGGESHAIDTVHVTEIKDIQNTIDTHLSAFEANGVSDAVKRIIGIVVQPGVEFDHSKVIRFDKDKATAISQFIENTSWVYEAHSTDYQTEAHLKQLVQGHFAILKVGPALTFALREALFALAEMEAQLVAPEKNSQFKQVVDSVLLDDTKYWKAYYGEKHSTAMTNLHFSFSDRIRYYWTDERIQKAVDTMSQNLDEVGIPLSVLSQYLPNQYLKVSSGDLASDSTSLIIDKIGEVVGQYARACE